jgi:hypothetical protein
LPMMVVASFIDRPEWEQKRSYPSEAKKPEPISALPLVGRSREGYPRSTRGVLPGTTGTPAVGAGGADRRRGQLVTAMLAPGRKWELGASRRSRGMRVPLHASATDCPLLKFGIFTIGHGHLLALTILIGPDRSTTIRLPLASLPRTP